MKPPRLAALAIVATLGLALPASAGAATTRCEGIGKTITKLRAKGLDCHDAVTLSAKWAETYVKGGSRVVRIDGIRCVRRSNNAVRCAKGRAIVVTFRFRRP